MKFPAIRLNPLGMLLLSACAMFFVFVYASGWYAKEKNDPKISLKHLLAVSISIAELGGSKVREVKLSKVLKQSSKGKTLEGADDPLTAGDILSHRAMVNGLKKIFPNLQVISEEIDKDNINHTNEPAPVPQLQFLHKISDVMVPSSEIRVWIDPLDATKEFTEELYEYVTTMVCVAVRGAPVIGVIHQPFKNNTVWAWAKHASSMNLDPKIIPGKPRQIIVSRSHAGKVEEVAKAAFGPDVVVTPAGGSGYKALKVAEGKVDAYIHVTLIKKWDICAGNAVLNALGGQMTTLDGNQIGYDNIDDSQNRKGLLATLKDHDIFLEKLVNLKN